jgi:hypothetical protein
MPPILPAPSTATRNATEELPCGFALRVFFVPVFFVAVEAIQQGYQNLLRSD